MIITISGMPGSGKTTVGKMLAKRLGYKFYSVGDLRGRMAGERGMTIDQLNSLGEKEDWTDRKVDDEQKRLGETEKDFVIDGRLSFHFIPDSFKIFLTVNLTTGARRVMGDERADEKVGGTLRAARESLEKRMKSDKFRYRKYYGVDFLDEKNYDLVIDTGRLTPEQVVGKITVCLGVVPDR